MQNVAALLANAPTPDALPSTRSRALLLNAVARHEARLQATRERMQITLHDGELHMQGVLKALPGTVQVLLSAGARDTETDLDEIAASCEDSLVSICAAVSAADARRIVDELTSTVRRQQRRLPSSLVGTLDSCVAAAEAALHDALLAVEGGVGATLQVLHEGSSGVQVSLAKDMAAVHKALCAEVLRAAQVRGGAQAMHGAKWGAMWSRLDELINAGLQRCLQAAHHRLPAPLDSRTDNPQHPEGS